MAKIYPNRVLEEELRKRNVSVRLMWEIPGPKYTSIAWISCYLIAGSMVAHVITYKPNGWDVLTNVPAIMIDATVDTVIEQSKKFMTIDESLAHKETVQHDGGVQ